MEQDVLDLNYDTAASQRPPYYLLAVEVGLLVIGAILFLLGASVLHFPWLLLLVLIYGGYAAFFKPQFTRASAAKVGLGIWNCCQLAIFALAVFYMSKSFTGPSYYFRIISLSSISLYYLVNIYFESDRFPSWRSGTVLFINTGFSLFFIGCLFKVESWYPPLPFLDIAPFLVLIGFVLLVIQLVRNRSKHFYYWFYLPRTLLLLVSFFTSYFL